MKFLIIALFVVGFGTTAFAEDFTHLSIKSTTTLDGVTITGGLGGDTSLGTSFANIGDIDGDGIDDYALGAGGITGTSSPGNVHILFMSDINTVREVVTITGDTPNGPSTLHPGIRFGETVTTLGDLDNDGVNDLLVGAPDRLGGEAGPGQVFILYLNSDGTVKRTSLLDGYDSSPGDRFGYAMENLGDFDGNGTDDLLIAAPGDLNPAGVNMLNVHIILMNPDGSVLDAIVIDGDDIRPTPTDFNDWFGVSVASLGDINSDGVIDIGIGAGTDADAGVASGSIFILFMNRDGSVNEVKEIDANTPNAPPIGEYYDMSESLAGIGDLDGDGVPDIAVGAPGYFVGFEGSGYAYIIFMNSDGTPKNSITINDDPNFPSLGNTIHFGWFVTGMGDLNNDGTMELGITTFGDDNIYLVSVNSDGSVSDTSTITGLDIGIMSPDTDHFGESITNLGDLDGDGNDDIAVGAPGRFDGSLDTGELFIIFLNDDGTAKDTVEINADTPNGPAIVGNDRFGDSVASIGDLNNDGVTDIAVGAPGHMFGGATGKIFILLLNNDGTVQESIEINGDTENGPTILVNDRFGQSIANLGDLNNDGVTDIAVGAPGHALEDVATVTGKAFVLFLNSEGGVIETTEITNESVGLDVLELGDRFGWSMATIGDIDNDGDSELAIGATGHYVQGDATGDLFILHLNNDGTVENTSEINAHTPNGPLLSEGDRFGESVANAGDINRDGVDDIIVGAPGHAIGSNETGDVFVLFMNEDGTVRFTEEVTADTPNGPMLTNGDRFGRSVVGISDLDGDGHDEIAVGAPAFPSTHIIFTSTDTSHFITTWGVGELDRSITIPVNGYPGIYTVNWGDGTTPTTQSGDATHVYENPGVYQVEIYGDFAQIAVSAAENPFNALKLLSIDQWGSLHWRTMENAFKGAANMEYNATDTPNLTDVNNMSYMFYAADKFNGDLSSWDVSDVNDMSFMFIFARSFDSDLSSWDVSSVTDMSYMFTDAASFNQPLNSWDVSNVTDTSYMFTNASSFNQPLDKWDVSSVTDMSYMFSVALNFNQPLNSWDVSSVTDTSYMFLGATQFNQPLDEWDVSSVVDTTGMFSRALFFNQPLNSWDVSSVNKMPFMFSVAPSFNQPLNSWDVSNVTDMEFMFSHATSFNQNLNDWDVSSVTDMQRMFIDTTFFNSPLDKWDVSNVTNMDSMFAHTNSFNQDIGEWDVSSVDNMHAMFLGADSFTHDISNWKVDSVTDMSSMFAHANSFNQPLNWDVSNVTNMNSMFLDADQFNQDLSNWDVSSVTDMHSMFSHANSFNQPLDWDVSSVDNMRDMFLDADKFNQDLNDWDVSMVTNMHGMFADTREFNQPLDNWNVSNVTDMSSMFENADYFNQDIGSWNVSSVTDMSSMFAGTITFNQPLNSWNVSNVTDTSSMFEDTRQFNQPLDNWNVSNVTNMSSMFAGSLVFNQPLHDWNISPGTDTKLIFDDARALTQENVWPFTIDIITFIDRNENGMMDASEDTLSNVQIIIHVPDTSMVDAFVTDHNGIVSKEYSMPTPFHVIATPPNGYTITTQIGESDPGVYYIADPMLSTTHQLAIGLVPN